MAKLQLIEPKKRTDGPGCKVYHLKDKKFVAGTPQEVTAKEKTYLMKTDLFEEVAEDIKQTGDIKQADDKKDGKPNDK